MAAEILHILSEGVSVERPLPGVSDSGKCVESWLTNVANINKDGTRSSCPEYSRQNTFRRWLRKWFLKRIPKQRLKLAWEYLKYLALAWKATPVFLSVSWKRRRRGRRRKRSLTEMTKTEDQGHNMLVFLGFEPYVTLLCLPRLSYSSAPKSPTKATDLLHPAPINHFPGVQDAQVSTLADTRTQLEVC